MSVTPVSALSKIPSFRPTPTPTASASVSEACRRGAKSLTTQDSIGRAGVHNASENYAAHQRVGQREQASAGHDNLRGASQLRTGRRLAPTTRPERPHLALGSPRKKTS